MSRGVSGDMLAALSAPNFRPALFAELRFDGGTVYTTSLPVTVPWDGHDWLGLGQMGGISAIEEGDQIQAYGVALTLSGVEPAYVSIAQNEQYQGRIALIYFGVFNDAYQVVATPKAVFRGRMDVMRLTRGETFTIKVTCEGRLADFERPRVRRYNHEDQTAVYPNDRGFEFVPQMVEKALNWGVPN